MLYVANMIAGTYGRRDEVGRWHAFRVGPCDHVGDIEHPPDARIPGFVLEELPKVLHRLEGPRLVLPYGVLRDREEAALRAMHSDAVLDLAHAHVGDSQPAADLVDSMNRHGSRLGALQRLLQYLGGLVVLPVAQQEVSQHRLPFDGIDGILRRRLRPLEVGCRPGELGGPRERLGPLGPALAELR